MPTVNEKRGLGLILAILGAFALYAVALAPAAKATEVLPTNQQIKMVNNGSLDFLPTNASTNPGIRCFESQFEFTIEDTNQRNKNQPGVGPKSTDYGSVTTHMDPNSRDPSEVQGAIFDDCGKWDFRQDQAIDPAEVTTSDQNGAWTVAFHTSPGQAPMITVTVPSEGIQIEVDAKPCKNTLSVHPTRGGVITPLMGEWDNPPEGRNDNGQARIDAQIDFVGDCQGKSPYQLEGIYEPRDRPVTVEVRP